MSQFTIEAHRILSNMINLFPLIVGIWGLVLFVLKRPPDGNYNGALAIGVGLFAIEAVVGVVLLLTGSSPNRIVHLLYGVAIILVIPAIFVFTRGRNARIDSLLYGLGMLFIWGMAERAVTTAGR